jgi:hypothetical protein
MMLAIDEFIRRFLTHVLPKGLHCIRHYGLLAKSPKRGCPHSPRILDGKRTPCRRLQLACTLPSSAHKNAATYFGVPAMFERDRNLL